MQAIEASFRAVPDLCLLKFGPDAVSAAEQNSYSCMFPLNFFPERERHSTHSLGQCSTQERREIFLRVSKSSKPIVLPFLYYFSFVAIRLTKLYAHSPFRKWHDMVQDLPGHFLLSTQVHVHLDLSLSHALPGWISLWVNGAFLTHLDFHGLVLS